jgi:hypothetical protein
MKVSGMQAASFMLKPFGTDMHDPSWGSFRIRVKSGHKAGTGAPRTRLVISPTTPRLALAAISFRASGKAIEFPD